jgi:hypothetical protein
MNFKTTKDFDREAKRISKKYPSLAADIRVLKGELIDNPYIGTALGQNMYKVRMAITSKGKGKSGGARVITCIKIIEDTIHLLTIYDKSETDNISDEYLDELRQSIE